MNVLIVGAGRMGTHHARTVANAGDTPVTLDPNPLVNADLRDWPAKRPDAVIVAAPIADLHTQTLRALQYEVPVLVEKPAADSVGHALELLLAAPHLAVGFTERHNPAYRAFRAAYDDEPVLFCRYGPRTTNPRLDLAIHDIDLANDLDALHADFAYGQGIARREITAPGVTADLLRWTITRNGHTSHLAGPDPLTEQYLAWKLGEPTATIRDAVAAHRRLTLEPKEIAA